MEELNTQTVETSIDTSTQATTPSVDASTPHDTQSSIAASVEAKLQQAAQTPNQPQAPQYTPNFKFKYTGKQGDKWSDAEGEFDEPIRGLIKSKEDEEKWRKIYEKAHGLDYVAESRDKFKTELNQYKQQWQPVVSLAQQASQYLQKGDMRGFFEVLGVKSDVLRKHVLTELQQEELRNTNPQQYQLLEQNRQYQRQLEMEQQRLSQLEQNNLQLQAQMIDNELNTTYAKPEVSALKNNYDATNGPGAFDKFVRARGNQIYFTEGRIASPSQVVQEIVKSFSFASPSQAMSQGQGAPAQPQTVLATQKPTIPIASGGSVSAVRQKPKSIADIEKLAESL
jgi:hypothetical protein